VLVPVALASLRRATGLPVGIESGPTACAESFRKHILAGFEEENIMNTHLSCPSLSVSLFLRVLVFSVLFVIPVFFVSAYTSPGKPEGRVSDFARIFTAEQKSLLETRVAEYARPAGLEMAVVTVSSLEGETIESYAVRLFEEWGIGKEMSDNGVLLLVAPNEREVRIEVGYGLEQYLTDAESSYIIRTVIVPAFASGDYFSGIGAGIDAIESAVNADPSEMPAEAGVSLFPSLDGETIVTLFFVLVAQILPLMMYSKSWWLGGVVGFVLGIIIWSLYAGAVLAVVGLIVDYLLSKKYGGKRPTGTGMGGMFFGGGLGGRGGGGFGGFGGGMSGGGGASGRW
jgi:uncharacterized protein